MTDDADANSDLLRRIIFRSVQPTDIPRCHEIESASRPEDEAASKSTLQYRQHLAAPYFRCAFLVRGAGAADPGDGPVGTTGASTPVTHRGMTMNPRETLKGMIVGFVCSTRCDALAAESMKKHDAAGRVLAIHSVVVQERYRNSGVATAMLQDYITEMERLNSKGNPKTRMEKMVMLAKEELLAFYVRNGFSAVRASPVVHGKEEWFELERKFVPEGGDGNEKTRECYIVDSFADAERRGSGNPAGVVLLDAPPEAGESDGGGTDASDSNSAPGRRSAWMATVARELNQSAWMATVARELNQSETAFVWPLSKADGAATSPAYAIRYYTRSGAEVDLCGHATLAAASVLMMPKKLEDPRGNHKVAFFARKDELGAELLVPPANSQSALAVPDNRMSQIAMNFPWKNVTPLSGADCEEGVLKILAGAFSKSISHFAEHLVHIGTTDGKEDLLIELTERGFDSLPMKVNYASLTEWQGYSRGVIVCCLASARTNGSVQKGKPAADFRSRFFGPKVGIDEDPVTGSAHCLLGPYFADKLGKDVVIGKQDSERGGLVKCILNPDEGRVCIVGTAVTTFAGQLLISL